MNKIFVINPGSTSTKIALFEEEKKVFSETVEYDAKELEHSRTAVNGVHHPAQLGGQIAKIFADEYHCPVYTVNPPEVDEFEDVTRVTGIKAIRRESHLHALNLKETAIHHCSLRGQKYEEQNLIVCHLGGGISVSAHKKGRMVDGNDIAKGMGPIAPTRCGTIPAGYLIEYIFQTGKTEADYQRLCTRSGGIVDLLGTSDMKEVYDRVKKGDGEAGLVWDAMVYSICKEIGAMSTVLFGEFEMEAMANGVLRVLRGEEQAKKYDEQKAVKLHESFSR